VKREKRLAHSEKRRLSGGDSVRRVRTRGKERKNERTRGLCGRDSIKRTHINESFQSKTELYADASISTCVCHACTYIQQVSSFTVAITNCRVLLYADEYLGMLGGRPLLKKICLDNSTIRRRVAYWIGRNSRRVELKTARSMMEKGGDS